MELRPRIFPTALALGCVLATWAASPAQSFDSGDVGSGERLSAADLEELLAPIALYPDTLLANMLAASVYPEAVTEAAAYIAGGRSVTDDTPVDWNPAVKAVAMFPEALRKLSEYPDWTTALGQAYLAQPDDVLAAVQSLRAKAYANESLQSTSEQNVVVEGDTIMVEPADPEIVYVPTYDPVTVYVERYEQPVAPLISFGVGVAVGSIYHAVHCDWYRRCVVWAPRPPWRPGAVVLPGVRPGIWGRPWAPSPGRPRPIRPGWSRPWVGCSSRPSGGLMPGRPIGSRPVVGNWRPPRPQPRPPRPTVRPTPPRPRPPGLGTDRPSWSQRPSVRPERPGGRPDRPTVRPDNRPGRLPAMRPDGSNRPERRPVMRPSPGDRPARPPTARPAPSGRPGRPEARPAPNREPRPSSPPSMSRPRPQRPSGFVPPSRGGMSRPPSRPSGSRPTRIDRPQRPPPRPQAARGRRG